VFDRHLVDEGMQKRLVLLILGLPLLLFSLLIDAVTKFDHCICSKAMID